MKAGLGGAHPHTTHAPARESPHTGPADTHIGPGVKDVATYLDVVRALELADAASVALDRDLVLHD